MRSPLPGRAPWIVALASLALFLLTLPPGALRAEPSRSGEPSVAGEYIEARTCDVWTGPCFANGEINLRGDNAVVGWVVRSGGFGGVPLKDLAIVAVLDAEGTLCTSAEGAVKSAVYVDERASDEQARALLAMAEKLAGKYLKNVVRVEKTRISYRRDGSQAQLEVGSRALAAVRTAMLSRHCDAHCGNEERAYPPLAGGSEVECAKAIENSYSGAALGNQWSDPNKRSAMIGRFAL